MTPSAVGTIAAGRPVAAGGTGQIAQPHAGSGSHPAAVNDLRTGVGVTPTTINLGITFSGDQGAAGAQLGGSGAKDPQKETAQAIVDYVNKLGGIAGRKVVPVWYDVQYTNGTTDAQRAQEQCATFTEDHKVFAAGPFPTMTEVQATCMKKAGSEAIFSMTGARLTFDDQDIRTYGNALWSPNIPSIDRVWIALVKQAVKDGYFTKGAKVGAAIYNTAPYNRSVANTLVPALKKIGVTLADTCKIRVAADVNDVAGYQSDAQSCQLRFAGEGITHVMGGAAAQAIFLFGDNNYRPRYALHTGGTGAEQSIGGSDLTSSYRNMTAIGWAPGRDFKTTVVPPFAHACEAIVKKAGVNQPNVDESRYYCDYLFFVKAALEQAPAFTQAGFQIGARKVTSSAFVPSVALGTRFDDRTFGPSMYRKITYDFACHQAGKADCFRYVGGQLPF